MKKLIAILVVFAVLTTAVFAQANFGGSVGMSGVLLEGDSTDDSVISARFGDMWSSLWWNWSNDDNTAGAKIGIDANLGKLGIDASASVSVDFDEEDANVDVDVDITNQGDGFSGSLWWRPIQQIKIDVFHDDGAFYRGNAIAWGYHANSAAGNVATIGSWNDSGWNSFSGGVLSGDNNVGFFRGYFGRGMAITVYPVDGLELGVGLPLGGAWEDINITGHIGYEINGIGKFNASFRREYDFASWVQWAGSLTAPTIGIDFTTWALPGINIEIGALIPLGGNYQVGWWHDNERNDDLSLPISIGVGFTMNQWSGEAFHLYARAGVMLPNENFIIDNGYSWGAPDLIDYSDTTVIGLGINPSYAIDGVGRVFFDLGIGMVMKGDDSDFFWHFNPYLRMPVGIGDLYVGFNIWNGTGRGYEAFPVIQGEDSTGHINFAIPIYFEMGF